jgi:hypothetical protein
MGGAPTLVSSSGTAASQAGTADNVQLGNGGEIAGMTAASGVSTPLVFATSFSPSTMAHCRWR